MYHIFMHSSVDGHLVCFHVLVIVNSGAVNTGVHVSFRIMFYPGPVPRSGIAGSFGFDRQLRWLGLGQGMGWGCKPGPPALWPVQLKQNHLDRQGTATWHALLPDGMTWLVNLGHRAPDQCKPSSKRSEKILNAYSRATRFAGWQKKPSGHLNWFGSLREALCMRSELGGYLAGRIRKKRGEFKNVPEG